MQRFIEMVIGRLLTDEEFRERFVRDPHRVLEDLLAGGTHLTPTEVAALVAMDLSMWDRVADEVDPRLQKASLKSPGAEPRPAFFWHDVDGPSDPT